MSIELPIPPTHQISMKWVNPWFVCAKCMPLEEMRLLAGEVRIHSQAKKKSLVMIGQAVSAPEKPSPHADTLQAGTLFLFNLVDRDMNPTAQPAQEIRLFDPGYYFVWSGAIDAIVENDDYVQIFQAL